MESDACSSKRLFRISTPEGDGNAGLVRDGRTMRGTLGTRTDMVEGAGNRFDGQIWTADRVTFLVRRSLKIKRQVSGVIRSRNQATDAQVGRFPVRSGYHSDSVYGFFGN